MQFDDAANVALKGKPDFTISGRIHKKLLNNPNDKKYLFLRYVVDGFFKFAEGEIDHCKNAYDFDVRRSYFYKKYEYALRQMDVMETDFTSFKETN